jgi:hypothetical protein
MRFSPEARRGLAEAACFAPTRCEVVYFDALSVVVTTDAFGAGLSELMPRADLRLLWFYSRRD